MVELTEEEKKYPYAKYFYQPMAPVPEDKKRIADGPAADSHTFLPIEERNRFLAGDKDTLSVGFGVAENGTGFVANSTFMPDVTVAMMDWWFGWHSVTSDLRYKIWDPEDHYRARADKPDYVKNPAVPENQKTWGVTHHIIEDIGMGPSPLTLHFMSPADFGYDPALVGTQSCNSLVCASGEGNCPAAMTHKFSAVPGGILFESRFWIGYLYRQGQFYKVVPDDQRVPEVVPRSLFRHNIKEFANLAAILPHVYEEEKENW